MTNLFPSNLQNCMATFKLPLACVIAQSAPEQYEGSSSDGQKPYQGCALNNTLVCGPVI